MQVVNIICFRPEKTCSHALPMARGVLHFDALLRTAQQFADERKSREEGQDAQRFLCQISEEMCICFAMLADAASESLALTRFFDDESYDKSKQCMEIGHFLHRVNVLFTQAGCLSHGFTNIMLQHLQRRRTLWITTGGRTVAKTLGGPGAVTPQMLKESLGRMHNWQVLAALVLETEIPKFDSVASVCIFNLASKTRTESASFGEHAERVAKLCQADNQIILSCEFQRGGPWQTAASLKTWRVARCQ